MADEIVEPAAEVVVDTAAPAGDGQSAATSTATTVVPDAAGSESSTEGEQQPSPREVKLEAVMKALGRDPKATAEATPADASAVQDQSATDPAADPAVDVDPNAEQDAKLPFAQHPRFKQVLTQRARFKAEAETLKSSLTSLEPKAKNYDSIVNYARSAGMTQEFVGDLFHMGKLMLEDPIKFHESFKAEWERIETMVGARLPPDLAELVRAGKLAPEVAKETALLRTRTELAEGRHKRTTEQAAAEREAAEKASREREIEEMSTAVGNSVSGWDRQWKGSDPDYAIKQPYVRDRIEVRLNALLAKGELPSNADLLKLCNEVKEQVTKELKAILPKPGAIRTPNSGTTVAETTAVPNSKLQVARLALERMTG